MTLVLGIDQGASKTFAVLADCKGRILSTGKAGGADQSKDGIPYAVDRIREAVTAALQEAGAAAEDVKAAGAGICGADFPREYRLLKEALEERLGIPVTVNNDVMAALRAEYAGNRSMVICAGSGMNIGVRDADGREFCLGYYLDDSLQGGGAIGRDALRTVFDARIGIGQPTKLEDAFLKHFGLPGVDALIEWYYAGAGRREQDRVRELVPEIDRLALLGDPGAVQVLKRFAEGTARYALALMDQAKLAEGPLAVVFSGGVFKGRSLILKATIRERILNKNKEAQFLDAVYEPVLGGTVMAEELAYGGSVPEEVLESLKESAAKAGLLRSAV